MIGAADYLDEDLLLAGAELVWKAGPHGDEYRITSLYFDTAAFDVLHARGSFGRSKYRVRRYGASEVVYLERKLRKPGLLHKRRTPTPLTDVPSCSPGSTRS